MTQNSVASYIHQAVVVGVDGSTSSTTAVNVAAWEAERRGLDLALVHGYYETLPYQTYGWSPYVSNVPDVFEGPRAQLAEAARKVREVHPDLAVHTELVAGGGAGVLVELSRRARLIVVGSRGHGGFAGLSIGSVAAQVAAYASCPVMVIRGSGQDENPPEDVEAPAIPAAGPVLVAVAGSAHDQAAMGFGFEEADLRRVPLVVVNVWWAPTGDGIRAEIADPSDDGVYRARSDSARVIAEAVAGWSAKYPDVAVEQRSIEAANTSYAVVQESSDAGLVVVGCRGRGGFAGLVLGSVSRDLVGHACSPVAVVHDHT